MRIQQVLTIIYILLLVLCFFGVIPKPWTWQDLTLAYLGALGVAACLPLRA